jgi:TonB family protein
VSAKKILFSHESVSECAYICLSAFVLCLLWSGVVKFSASSSDHPVAESASPEELLVLAKPLNGLDESGAKSWHIKAKFEMFDTDGDNVDSGEFEEIFFGPKNYKRSYTGPTFNQTDIATPQGLYRSGAQKWPEWLFWKVRAVVVEPMELNLESGTNKLERVSKDLGTTKLTCVFVKQQLSPGMKLVSGSEVDTQPRYCFATTKPVLRLSAEKNGLNTVVYNDLFNFQGRYVGRNVQLIVSGKVRLTIHVESLVDLRDAKSEMFVPPPDAEGPITGVVHASRGMLRVVSSSTPQYPLIALRNHVTGVVKVKVAVGKDGHVQSATAASGPAELSGAAEKCVAKWVYEPLVIMGERVEAEQTVELNFSMSP